ncbi:hypothetical protein [Chlorogloeopsis fritschii]|uniref:hypothetical protein n=1 Tax=Chlorogloeopsis fritschii TaxID=1124 RepID=UPI001F15F917|nr:hypothetical protein [Chlorogloeopsis fritschii]
MIIPSFSVTSDGSSSEDVSRHGVTDRNLCKQIAKKYGWKLQEIVGSLKAHQ